MRPDIVTEAGLPTRLNQWWESIPFLTSSLFVFCGIIYLICLLVGYDSFAEICFLPSADVSHVQVYRIYTAILFHGSLLHIFFNMLAFVPLGSELERIMGSVRLLHIILLLATSNAVLHLIIALLVSHNPFRAEEFLMNDVFGLFSVPAKWHAFILLVVFQFMMQNVSLLGHLCGILSGFAYTYGLLNFLLPGTSFYSAIEASSWLGSVASEEEIRKLVAMGFDKTQVEVALAATDGNANVALEILVSQQG